MYLFGSVQPHLYLRLPLPYLVKPLCLHVLGFVHPCSVSGADADTSLEFRLSKASLCRKSTPRGAPTNSSVSSQHAASKKSAAAEPAQEGAAGSRPAVAEAATETTAKAGNAAAAATTEARSAELSAASKALSPCASDSEEPPLHGDSSNHLLAAVWQAASGPVLDLAAGEAQRRRLSPFFGLVLEVAHAQPAATAATASEAACGSTFTSSQIHAHACVVCGLVPVVVVAF